ncbi:hypothetical protein A3Q56_00674 [Intoshia linei]|uniref:glutamine synthetase n=1 Tax=Intoshia linei TaxID=1819745 RepID=A0A177BDD8_9BILA|nr:hypothetical protein A3Q56_00674 [Intoshia linei]
MENELGNTKIFEHYLNLEQPTDKYICTYVWIDGFGKTTRCKSRTLKYNKNQKITLKDIPQWDCYGYITAQPNEIMSYQYLKPVALYRDPFLKKTNKLVMCQTYDQDKNPTILNNRDETYKLLEKYKSLEFKFGFEQEYVLIGKNKKPFKPQTGFPPELGPHYCGTGLCNAFGRAIPISHYKACLYAGISIFGINGEATPAQWEYQLGELDAVGISDQLWMSRYILERISEEFGVEVTFQPKPVPGNWCGSGGHCNFSTNETRGIDGLE